MADLQQDTEKYVELRNINKTYGTFKASNNINLGIGKGKLIALLGPSGSGKTTILRMIAGLETADSGDIIIDGKVVYDRPSVRQFYDEVDVSGPSPDMVRFGGCCLYGVGRRVCRYGFFVCALSFFFLHVHYVPDNLCTRPGRYGFFYKESIILYRYGSSRRSLCPNADGIYRGR